MSEEKKEKVGIIDFLINHSKKIMISLICFSLLIATLSVAIYFLGVTDKNKVDPNNPIVVEMKGQKIYLNDYKERMFAALGGQGSPTAPAYLDEGIKEPVLNELVDLKIIDKELAKRKIQISDDELKTEAKKKFIGYDQADQVAQSAYRNYVRLQVGKDKLLSAMATWKEGFILYCYFDRADQSDMKNKPEADILTMRALQESYAKDYCTKAKERLEKGDTDYKSELEALTADSEIGEVSWKPYKMPFGTEIHKETFSSEYYHPSYDLFTKLSSLSNDKNKYYLLTLQGQSAATSETSEQMTVETPEGVTKFSEGKDSQKTDSNSVQANKDAMYAVVYIKDSHTGETANFNKWLNDKEKEYGVKLYIERIKI